VSIAGRVYNKFKSVRFTALIFSALIVIYFAGLVIPQKNLFESAEEYRQWVEKSPLNQALDFLDLTEIYTSPLTVFFLGLFFINLTVVLINRIPVVLRRAYLKGKAPTFGWEDIRGQEEHYLLRTALEIEAAKKQVTSFLKKRRWSLIELDSRSFLGIRNRYSPMGFFLFHLSFVFCLVGGLLITYTRFHGYVAITEGQVLGDARPYIYRVARRPVILKELPEFGLRLINVEPYYENEVPTDLKINLEITYRGKRTREVLRVNEPVKRGSLSMIVQDIGVAPLIELKRNGKVTDRAFVSLNIIHGDEDSFRFEQLKEYSFTAWFYPDYVVKDGIETSRSVVIRNPALHLVIEKEGRKINEKTLLKNDEISFNGYTMSFEGYRYWTSLSVVREYGKTPLIIGFILAALGLIMRLVFYQRRIRVALVEKREGTEVWMDGRSEYFNLSFQQDLGKLVSSLEEVLKR
jgi:cytochrome c biogenesis protein